MVEYLTELLQDACDYSWESAKGAHSVLLHLLLTMQGVVGERSKITKVVPCFKYNKGSCPRNTDHEWQNMLYSNIVANIVSLLSIDMKCISKKNAQKLQKTNQSCSWFYCK